MSKNDNYTWICYMRKAAKFLFDFPNDEVKTQYLTLGLLGEVGELKEALNKYISSMEVHKLELKHQDNLVKEAGDVLWYASNLFWHACLVDKSIVKTPDLDDALKPVFGKDMTQLNLKIYGNKESEKLLLERMDVICDLSFEIAEMTKKWIASGKGNANYQNYQRTAIAIRLTNIVLLLSTFGANLKEIADKNITKLTARHGAK